MVISRQTDIDAFFIFYYDEILINSETGGNVFDYLKNSNNQFNFAYLLHICSIFTLLIIFLYSLGFQCIFEVFCKILHQIDDEYQIIRTDNV